MFMQLLVENKNKKPSIRWLDYAPSRRTDGVAMAITTLFVRRAVIKLTFCDVRTGRLSFPWVGVCLAWRGLGRQQSILSTRGRGETVRVVLEHTAVVVVNLSTRLENRVLKLTTTVLQQWAAASTDCQPRNAGELEWAMLTVCGEGNGTV